MNEETIQIKIIQTNEILAAGQRNKDVQLFEGAWYFDPESVNMIHLEVSNRTYTCPYKGSCYWIDLKLPNRQSIENVGFTYFETKDGYGFVQDKIGLYYGRREATYQDFLATPV